MGKTTLWIILDQKNNKILLCMKKRWFGEWLWNGPWWKLEKEENINDWIIRETYEETWLIIKNEDLENFGVLHFYFNNNSNWDQDVYLFVIKKFAWELIETEEMKPKWFNIEDIPYNQMWEDDIIWLPKVLNWEIVEYDFIFWDNNKMINYKKY